MFRRKRDEGGLLDYAEEMHAVKRFLDKIHPIRDESCPPKSGFSYRYIYIFISTKCGQKTTPYFSFKKM